MRLEGVEDPDLSASATAGGIQRLSQCLTNTCMVDLEVNTYLDPSGVMGEGRSDRNDAMANGYAGRFVRPIARICRNATKLVTV